MGAIPIRHRSLEAYAAARAALIETEHAAAFDYSAVKTATATEKRADEIVKTLMRVEAGTLSGANGDGAAYDPAHQFRRAKHLIDTSKLFRIAQRAPKGALLHCHFDAMLPPMELVSLARERPNMHIKTDASLTQRDSFESALPSFQVLPKSEADKCLNVNIFAPTYAPGAWMLFSKFRESFPGGAAQADAWVVGKIVLHVDDIYHSSQTVNGIWKTFFRSFSVLLGLLRYETAMREYFKRVMWDLARDGINYAEMRAGFNYRRYAFRDDGESVLDHHEIMHVFSTTLAGELPKIKAEGLTFYGVKFIYSTLRDIEREHMLWEINTAIELKQAFPDLICGFDMCGQEDSGHPLSYWVPELLEMRQRCDALNLDLPFIFHAGETLDHGGDTDSNLFDAVLLGTKRIGHGYSLTKHPVLLDICKEKGIAIEMCPISNEVLGLCGSVTSHPLPVLLASNVPCTVNSDDPGVFHSSLSHDFHQIMVGSNKMSLMGWRVLVEWSFEYSMMSESEKSERLDIFREQWEAFCHEIVETYGKEVTS